MQIRKATLNDIPKIAKLLLKAFQKPPFNEKASTRMVTQSLRFYFKIGAGFVAIYKKEIVGVIYYKIEQFWRGPVLLVEDLAVKKEFERKNVGKRLMEKIEELAAKRKIKMITFITNQKSPAKTFYKKVGYKQRKDLIIFEKQIR